MMSKMSDPSMVLKAVGQEIRLQAMEFRMKLSRNMGLDERQNIGEMHNSWGLLIRRSDYKGVLPGVPL
jgi:hypothetical protein